MADSNLRWSQHHLATLQDLYGTGVSPSKIAKALNRSVAAINTHAQIQDLERLRRKNARQVDALHDEVQSEGLTRDFLSNDPVAFKIVNLSATNCTASNQEPEKAQGLSPSTRSKAIDYLDVLGIVYGHDFFQAGEFVLTQAANEQRPELPCYKDHFSGELPEWIILNDAFDNWLPIVCPTETNRLRYGQFIFRQHVDA